MYLESGDCCQHTIMSCGNDLARVFNKSPQTDSLTYEIFVPRIQIRVLSFWEIHQQRKDVFDKTIFIATPTNYLTRTCKSTRKYTSILSVLWHTFWTYTNILWSFFVLLTWYSIGPCYANFSNLCRYLECAYCTHLHSHAYQQFAIPWTLNPEAIVGFTLPVFVFLTQQRHASYEYVCVCMCMCVCMRARATNVCVIMCVTHTLEFVCVLVDLYISM